MKKFDNDILAANNNLQSLPYEVPAGYFDGLRKELKDIPVSSTSSAEGSAGKLTPYISIAAASALLVAAGGFFLGSGSGDDFSEEDFIVFSDDVPNTIFYNSSEQYADADMEEDFIEYLIQTGVELEDLEIF